MRGPFYLVNMAEEFGIDAAERPYFDDSLRVRESLRFGQSIYLDGARNACVD